MKQTDLKFSVICVTYNLIEAGRTDTFRQAIKSINDQNYPHVECIVIDGASTDGTVELIDEQVQAGHVDIFVSEPDDGLYYAMNKGAKMATGDYILFLNSDDFYHDENGLTEAAKLLQETNADFCYGPCYIMDENGNEKYRKGLFDSVVDGMRFCHQTMALRRSVFHEFDGFDTAFSTAADYDLLFRLAMDYPKSVRNSANFVTFREGGISANNSVVREQTIAVWLKNFSLFYPVKKSDMNTFYATKSLPIGLVVNLFLSEHLSPRFKFLLVRFLTMALRLRLKRIIRQLLLID